MTYVPKVYKPEGPAGGDKLIVTDGGEIEGQSGGTFDAQEGFEFFLNGNTVEAEKLANQYLSGFTVTQHGSADISSGSVISPAYGFHVLSAATGMSLASFTMPIPSAGRVIYLDGAYLVADANISVLTLSATTLVVNNRGSDLSSFEMSAANFVEAICQTDGTWTIVNQNNYTQHASS